MIKIFARERAETAPLEAAEIAALVCMFAAAIVLRLVPTAFFPSLNHQDELFQTLEQAHRLVFGYGEIPWEFHLGARSWLFPGALAGIMWLGDRIADNPASYLGAVHLALATLAATSVLCAFFWGRRWCGFGGGMIAAALPAFWPDAVYFGARSLNECAATPLLVLALYFLDGEVKRSTGPRRFAAGLFLGLATALRIQFAPVLALVLAWSAVEHWRRRTLLRAEMPLVIGIAVVCAAAGLLDAVTWRYPFQSLWLNFDYNVLRGVAARFGTEPWSYYLVGLIDHWGWYFPVIFVLAALGGWCLNLPIAAAIVILVAHSLVSHKEYRFIYPAVLLVLIVAGVGLAQLASWLARPSSRSRRGLAMASISGVALLSAVFASSASMRPMWGGGHDQIEAASYVAGLDHVCGVAVDGTYGAYTYFHHDVPYYWIYTAEDMARDAPGFNILLTTESAPREFDTLRCFGKVCVARRPGSCAPIPPRPIFSPQPLPAASSTR